MLRRFLLASGLILASTIGFASSAKAVSEPLEFTGTVPTACTLKNPVDGTLGVDGANTMLSSVMTGGTSAKIDVDCDGGSLSISAPVKTGGTGNTAQSDFESLAAKITTKSSVTVNSGAAGAPITTADTGTATVDMTVEDTTAAIQPGTYIFDVVVTATKGT